MPIKYDQLSTWVAIHDKRLCPDCMKMAGKTMTIGEWIDSGILPGNGHTICGDYCRCMIVPAKWSDAFGIPDAIDTSIGQIESLMAGNVPGDLPGNVMALWGVMLEKESGFSPDINQDIAESVKLFKADPDLFKSEYPKHFELLQKLMGI